MKYIPVPTKLTIHLVNQYDKPMKDADGGPAMKPYVEWLIDRTADPVFLSHSSQKQGVDALDLLMLARRQIKENCAREGAAVHGFEDEVARRLRHAILSPTGGLLGPQAFEHNWAIYVEPWKPEPKNEPPAVLAVEPQGSAPA